MPSLRLAYMIAPPDLVDTFITGRAHFDWSSPMIEQVALAAFIAEGHLGRYIRRTRALYAERRQTMADCARSILRGLLEVAPAEGGMHLLGWLPAGLDDRTAVAALADTGIEAGALSAYSDPPLERGGLILGYAPFHPREIQAGMERMAAVLERQSTPA